MKSDLQPRFWYKMLAFVGPCLAIASVPVITMALSREVLSGSAIAKMHLTSPGAVYGPAYTNPDKRYKLESVILHRAPIVALGSSRIMQLRASFFQSGERVFYNAGGIASRLWNFRRALKLIPTTAKPTTAIIALDQWSYNDNWSWAVDDPSVESEYSTDADALANLRAGFQAWPDVVSGKLKLSALCRADGDIGVFAITKGNGFRHDGSYYYADLIAHPSTGSDFQFSDTLARIRDGRQRYEYGAVVSDAALAETVQIARAYRDSGIEPVFVLPPFPPTVLAALRNSKHHEYLTRLGQSLREVLAADSVPLFDFTDCAPVGCTDAEFVDGSHGGEALYARMLLAVAGELPSLRSQVAASLSDRAARSIGKVELSP